MYNHNSRLILFYPLPPNPHILPLCVGYRTVVSKDYKIATLTSMRYKHLQQASLASWKGYSGPITVPDEYSDDGGGREISEEEELVEWMKFIVSICVVVSVWLVLCI